MVIVPNELSAAITAEIDRFVALHPEADDERALLEADLLSAFDRYGVVATIAPKEATDD
jgi:hypothetical protein